MKKAIIIGICLTLLLLCSCKTKEEAEPMESQSAQTVHFLNGVKDADVWILPETEANLKTTLWGTATAAGVQQGERREVPLCAPGDGGTYLLRMIDTDHYYYSAGGITLQPGWSMELKGADLHAVTLEVTDENGALHAAYQVFAARL